MAVLLEILVPVFGKLPYESHINCTQDDPDQKIDMVGAPKNRATGPKHPSVGSFGSPCWES